MSFDYSESEYKLLEETLKQLEFSSVLDYIAKYCLSEQGMEIISALAPNKNVEEVRREHDQIDEVIRIMTEDDPIPLENLPDIRASLHKSLVTNAVLTTTEILHVCEVIRVSRLIKNFLIARSENYPILFDDTDLLHENRILEKHIDEAIDETGNVRDSASRELARIRKEIQEKSARLRSRMDKIMKRVAEDDMIQEEFVTMREGRFVLPIKVSNKRQIQGIIHGVSQTGSTVFLEPSEIVEMNNEISLLNNEEKREIYRILSNLTGEIGVEAQRFLWSVERIAHIDSLMARANYALEFGGVKPDVNRINNLYMSNVRHPLLVQAKGRERVVPLSIEFTDTKRGHLISGPNAGGKTVALKSIGLNLAMALSGIYPFGECRTNFRMVYSSIGDHQSVVNDLSTFSSQILQLKEIVSASDPGSLVLIDEIGTGTDPQEGSALSAGILDTLIELKSFFVVTTHHSTLKSYALTRDVIENASMEFDEKELKPTYKFLSGVPGNSYAFVLAKSLGIQSTVIERANKYLGTRQSELEESISILQKIKIEAEELRRQAEQEKLKAEKARKDYEEKFKEVKLKRQVLMDEARKEAFEIVQKANAMVENTIREIKEEKRAVSEIKKDFNESKSQLEKQIRSIKTKDKVEKDDRPIKVGDSVIVDDTSTSVGVVLELDNNNQSALVDFNGIKFRFPIERISLTAEAPKPRKSNTDYITFDAKASLDIRGMRAGEGLRELDEFISKGLLANIQYLTIIHGKGTGALRQAVKEFLDNHHSVVSYRIGKIEEGGDGVTVVEV